MRSGKWTCSHLELLQQPIKLALAILELNLQGFLLGRILLNLKILLHFRNSSFQGFLGFDLVRRQTKLHIYQIIQSNLQHCCCDAAESTTAASRRQFLFINTVDLDHQKWAYRKSLLQDFLLQDFFLFLSNTSCQDGLSGFCCSKRILHDK